MKIGKWWIVLILLGVLLLAALVTVLVLNAKNRYEISWNLPEEESVFLEYGDEWNLPEITAVYDGTIWHFDRTEVTPVISGQVDTKCIGKYEVRITADYKKVHKESVFHVSVDDTIAPKILLKGEPEQTLSPKEPYEEEGYAAFDNADGDLTDQVVIEDSEPESIPKGYQIRRTYRVKDAAGNQAVEVRTISYVDNVPPVITLLEGEEITVPFGSEFQDPGFSVEDDCDENIECVTVEGTVDTGKIGTYTLTYRTQDSAGNTASAVRRVIVKDTQPPRLGLNGQATMYVKLGTGFSDPGAYANDAADGDISSRIQVSGGVNPSAPGIYTINYSVADSSGNAAYASRKVYVYERQAEYNPVNPGSHVVYLTFDDGPGPYTAQLLDILDRYNVKATFFVTNIAPDYNYMIAEEARRGHTIALHTYSHSYGAVYRSDEAYFADLQAISDLVAQQTGIRPNLIRFPGGSSNLTSRNYNAGIMSRLTQSVGMMGYLYCDWNVSSGDGDGSISRQAVIDNMKNGIMKNDVSVSLQHDPVKNSVDAVEEIIVWGLANGYTFLPMSSSTPMVHHTVQN